MEKRRTFDIAVFNPNGVRIVEVQGYPVEIPGMEDLEFFVHRTLGSKSNWNLSEVSTGLAIDKSYARTRYAAITEREYSLKKSGVEFVKSLVARNRKVADIKAGIVKGVMERMIGGTLEEDTYNSAHYKYKEMVEINYFGE